MSLSKHSIILVDNKVNSMFKTIEALKANFSSVEVFNSENDLMDYVAKHTVDAILLQLDLQPNDAIVVMKELRQMHSGLQPYIVIYSDNSDDFVQELALNSGADAFINFHQKSSVIPLYLKNLLRRNPGVIEDDKRGLIINTEQYLIYKNGKAFQLPRKEFKLFELLFNDPDKFFSKEDIADKLWHDQAVAKKRTIDVHIYNIRQFFGKRIIQSQKGRGYRINKKAFA